MNQDDSRSSKRLKITFIFFLIFVFFLILTGALIHIATNDKRLPKLVISESDKALRGNILSSKKFTLSTSKKLYKAVVDTRNIDPDKRELFIELFSTFSNIDKEQVRDKINSKFGFVTLTYKLDSRMARYVKQLSSRLFKLKVFIEYTDSDTKRTFLHGLSVLESGEYRIYPLKDTLTPVIGYVGKYEKNGFTHIKGKYGLEKYYDKELEGIQGTKIVGRRDVTNHIILDDESVVKNRYDGYNIITSISISLQKSIEHILDLHKEKLQAKEILASVMDSKTGNIIAIASSRRYEINNIKDADSLTISAIRYIFEPGSVMKPIVFALLLQDGKVETDDIVRTFNGRFKLGNKVVTDEHKYPYLSAENVIVHSSNIGMIQLSQRLDPLTYFQGLRDFGFGRATGIDLAYELSGSIPDIHRLKNSIFRATASYGYGIKVNFFHLLQAYNVFNNDGYLVEPSIGEYLSSLSHKQKLKNKKRKPILSPSIANVMNKILVKTVNEGTGKNAITEGIIVGGKTGTAQIAVRGVYEKIYNNSFFGFANDKNSRYTIGVTVIEPNPDGPQHFASKSAVPVFKDIVDTLVEKKFLTPIN
jgi:cell division protein FtsI (penicillin-binding protein 3)